MATENRSVSKLKMQDQKDAWDTYASAALSVLLANGFTGAVATGLAAEYATNLLAERNKLFLPKPGVAKSDQLKL